MHTVMAVKMETVVKHKWKLLGATAVIGALTTWAISDKRAFDECMRGIHVDVIPIWGETWQEHSARMDEAARSACREWS